MRAAAQRPLHDAELEGERVLHFLETLPPSVLFAELLSVGFSAAVQLLGVVGPAAELPVVRRQLECLVAAAGPAMARGVAAVGIDCSVDLQRPSGQDGTVDSSSASDVDIDGSDGPLQRLPSWVPILYGSGLSSSSFRRLLLLLGCTEHVVVAAQSLLLRLGHPFPQQPELVQPHGQEHASVASGFAVIATQALIAAALNEPEQQPVNASIQQQQQSQGASGGAVAVAAAIDLCATHRREVDALLTHPLDWQDSESSSDGESGSSSSTSNKQWPVPFQREWLLEVHGSGSRRGGPAGGDDIATRSAVLQRMYVKALHSEVRIATAVSCEPAVP
ncbi:expressed protein [Chlorella variabilis]|uniref:Expressed protein n=1 Tax=Chlorella variabilis TaxID=554065 RepID=E1Z949_CHLVA|nr:expressed protein [Chlorella variabilis]EFN57717.1 expressed protein [Chlorella variabilis]|eukprot:XP_005849819.1 expressed protein [Chlorella variabilis]